MLQTKLAILAFLTFASCSLLPKDYQASAWSDGEIYLAYDLLDFVVVAKGNGKVALTNKHTKEVIWEEDLTEGKVYVRHFGSPGFDGVYDFDKPLPQDASDHVRHALTEQQIRSSGLQLAPAP